MQRVLLTGAGGFVGRALAAVLPSPPDALAMAPHDWEERLARAPLEDATVFHLAARVHDARERDAAAFQRDNAGKTRRLAEEAARRGARRLVFMSTIKVHGEESPGRPFTAGDAPDPRDAYARSKLEGEQAVREVAAATRLEVVTVRPPLVLGAGARSNVASMIALADSPWPLPFAAIANRRSFVHVDDLARLLLACGDAPQAAGKTFIAAHRVAMSTPSLVRALRAALGRPARLFECPTRVLEVAASAAGQAERMRRLTRSLEADATATEATLGWTATIDLAAAAFEMARAWREARP
jgi:nucleoside-diphosphate-sugar epimerase